MQRIQSLTRYQKIILAVLALQMVVFSILYPLLTNRDGFAFKNTVLPIREEGGNTVYSGLVHWKKLTVTVTPLLLDLLCALLWWDPLLWLLRRRSRRVLELRCDFGVLRTLDNEGRTDYYDIILQTARMAHAHKGHPHAFRLAAPPIVERFELGLDFARIERQSARYARLLHLAILLCWLLSYMVVFRAGTPLWI